MRYFILFIFIIFSSALSHAQLYVHFSPYYSCCNSHFIVIGDSSYYNRIDKMMQAKYEEEIQFVDTAYVYLNMGDYETAEFWARKVSSFEELYPDRYFLLTFTSANMNNRSRFKMYYKKLKEYLPPDELRKAKEKLIEIGAIKK